MKNVIVKIASVTFFVCFCAVAFAGPITGNDEQELRKRAQELAQKFLIVDTHIDVPYRLNKSMEDISQRTSAGDFDYVRAKAGGLNVPFMSIYIPASYQKSGGAKEFADSLIDMVEGFAAAAPDKFAIAKTIAEVQKQFEAGQVSLAMGIENGAPIEGDLANLKHFYDRGIRYITLTHAKWNHICDSSYDKERKWNGLSPFGRELIGEMNRIGMMIDISHVSDSTFYQVVELSKAPLIASHSSCRAFTPGWERNMNDDMIRVLAENGGVIMINFGSAFLRSEYQDESKEVQDHIRQYLASNDIEKDSKAGKQYREQQRVANPVGTIADVVAHIDHVVNLTGVDHVGLGSDFDGVFALPEGLQDASEYPNLIYELLKKGYSESDIEKICSGNFMRVWSQVEQIAAELRQAGD